MKRENFRGSEKKKKGAGGERKRGKVPAGVQIGFEE